MPVALKKKDKLMKSKPSLSMQNGEIEKNVINHAPIDIYTACSFTENSSQVLHSELMYKDGNLSLLYYKMLLILINVFLFFII